MNRQFGIILSCTVLFGIDAVTSQVMQFPEWEPGILEIHHIQTGRGDAAYSIFPDGTTLLIDAGDMSETHPRTTSRRNTPLTPNVSKSAPEWIVDYIDQFKPKKLPRKLNYALITHYHDDHFGELDSLRQRALPGDYALTGIMAVGNQIPIHKLIDRGFEYPINLKDKRIQESPRFSKDPYGMITTLKEYWRFIDHEHLTRNLINEPLQVGSSNQIKLEIDGESYPEFRVRNIVSNGNVWNGYGENQYFSLFDSGVYPGENPLSNGIRIDYGPFNYFTGGDLSGVDALGQNDLNSVESHIAPIIGPVEVAVLNHHGNRDSQNAYYVRTLRPQVWIQQSWTADHPGSEVLRRLLSRNLYPGERWTFATSMLEGTHDVLGGLLDNYSALQGHIVLRVYDRGKTFEIYVFDHLSTGREATAKFGPYESR